jgi:hypothetical protein
MGRVQFAELVDGILIYGDCTIMPFSRFVVSSILSYLYHAPPNAAARLAPPSPSSQYFLLC